MLLSSRRTLTLPPAALLVLGPGLSALLLSGCFIGDAADGLACELDADCGLGVVCAADPAASGAKCCGGTCLVAGDSTGPGSTSRSSSSTEDSTTTVVDLCGNGEVDEDDGETCDVAISDGPPCADDCRLLCGNGVVDEGEICDWADLDGPDCGPTCTLCGNDFLDEGEGCDEEDNDNCGEDCQYISLCGNGFVDEDEVCDVWGLPDGETCSSDCTEWVAFEWDTQELGGFCEDPADCSRWHVIPGDGAWGSGQYQQTDDTWMGPPAWPEAVLRTERMAFPRLVDGDVIRVTLNHEFALNQGLDPRLFVDYVELSLESVGGGQPARNIALANDTISCVESVGNDCGGRPIAEDYCGRTRLVRAGGTSSPASPGTPPYTYDVTGDGIEAGDQRLRFRVQYDCFNLVNGGVTPPPDPDAWKLFGVRVSITRPRP